MRVLLDTRIGDVDEDEVDTCESLILNWMNAQPCLNQVKVLEYIYTDNTMITTTGYWD